MVRGFLFVGFVSQMYPKMYPKFQEAAFGVDPGGWGSDARKVGVFLSSLRQQNDRFTPSAITVTLRVSTPNLPINPSINQRITKRSFRLVVVGETVKSVVSNLGSIDKRLG